MFCDIVLLEIAPHFNQRHANRIVARTLVRHMQKTKGQLEAEISDAIIRFEKEYMGRGPLETKTYIVDDLVIVRLKGVLTRAECQLAETSEASIGRELIKRMRHALLEKGRPMLDAIVKDVVGVSVKSLHTDLSTVTGERLIVFSLEGVPDILTEP